MTSKPDSSDDQRQPAAGTKPSASDPQRTAAAGAPSAADPSGNVSDPEPLDAIDEAEYESFPASDPPSYTGSACTPSVPKRDDPQK